MKRLVLLLTVSTCLWLVMGSFIDQFLQYDFFDELLKFKPVAIVIYLFLLIINTLILVKIQELQKPKQIISFFILVCITIIFIILSTEDALEEAKKQNSGYNRQQPPGFNISDISEY